MLLSLLKEELAAGTAGIVESNGKVHYSRDGQTHLELAAELLGYDENQFAELDQDELDDINDDLDNVGVQFTIEGDTLWVRGYWKDLTPAQDKSFQKIARQHNNLKIKEDPNFEVVR